uniref:Uncharacterized protein n=1 Tax=Pristionchus pacificus TaxID=54126 RepID=A0A2A6BD66_PRIPA|eukprot:PDM63817.1 hypothetical protein PRIPAC_49790 [Pristionchus pacificus]
MGEWMGEGMDRAPSVEHNWVTRDAASYHQSEKTRDKAEWIKSEKGKLRDRRELAFHIEDTQCNSDINFELV